MVLGRKFHINEIILINHYWISSFFHVASALAPHMNQRKKGATSYLTRKFSPLLQHNRYKQFSLSRKVLYDVALCCRFLIPPNTADALRLARQLKFTSEKKETSNKTKEIVCNLNKIRLNYFLLFVFAVFRIALSSKSSDLMSSIFQLYCL